MRWSSCSVSVRWFSRLLSLTASALSGAHAHPGRKGSCVVRARTRRSACAWMQWAWTGVGTGGHEVRLLGKAAWRVSGRLGVVLGLKAWRSAEGGWPREAAGHGMDGKRKRIDPFVRGGSL
eukprot:3467508-Pleurochrysis_carterae.AAC.2